MREMIRMVVVLTVLSAFSGGLLAAIRNGTADQIENQKIQFVKGPVLKELYQNVSNDPLTDRFKITDGDKEYTFFVGVTDGVANGVAFDVGSKGFGGDIGVMVAINVVEDKLIGASITTHQETPGVGAKAKDDTGFKQQFAGIDASSEVKVNQDGGSINAVSGATITSRGVCAGVTTAIELYKKLKPQIEEQLKNFK